MTIANLFLPFLIIAIWFKVISSVTLLPLIEMAPAEMNSRAFFFDSARLVKMSISTRLVSLEAVGKKLPNSEISSAENLVKSVLLLNNRLVRFSMVSAFSLP